MRIDIPTEVFWKLTPKTIQVYFRADEAKQKKRVQELWLAGAYVRAANISSFQFDEKRKPPEYPKMPYSEEVEEELVKDEKWLEMQRKRAYNHFASLLTKMSK